MLDDILRIQADVANIIHPVEGTISRSLASETDDAFVTVDGYQIGPCPWMPRRGGPLPQRGDRCLLIEAEGKPWIAAWWTETAPPVLATQVAVDALTAALAASDAASAAHAAAHGLGTHIPATGLTSGLFAVLPRVKAKRTTAQSLTNGVPTAVQFTSEDYDSATMHDNVTNNTRLVASVAGCWSVKTQAEFANGATQLGLTIQKNGATVPGGDLYGPAVGNVNRLHLAVDVELAATDYIEVQATQVSGGALNLNNAMLSMHWFSL